MEPPVLVTITVSHYCEKARWGLERAGIRYREHRHAPGFHVVPVRRLSGGSGTPILATASGVIADSTNILLWANGHAAAGNELYPAEPAANAEVLALEEGFDEQLGPHARRAAYFHLLSVRSLMIPMWTHAVPRHERLLMPLIFLPLRGLVRSAMRIDADGAARSVASLRVAMQRVSERLRDGRRYLAGDRFGAADIAFASLAAPVLWPDGYAVPLPALESLPDGFAALIRELRATPAGDFGLRMYREERHRLNAAGRAPGSARGR